MELRRTRAKPHPTEGLVLERYHGRLLLRDMDKGTSGSRMIRWRSRMRGAWLRKINDTTVDSVAEVELAFSKLRQDGAEQCTLVLLHP